METVCGRLLSRVHYIIRLVARTRLLSLGPLSGSTLWVHSLGPLSSLFVGTHVGVSYAGVRCISHSGCYGEATADCSQCRNFLTHTCKATSALKPQQFVQDLRSKRTRQRGQLPCPQLRVRREVAVLIICPLVNTKDAYQKYKYNSPLCQ